MIGTNHTNKDEAINISENLMFYYLNTKNLNQTVINQDDFKSLQARVHEAATRSERRNPGDLACFNEVVSNLNKRFREEITDLNISSDLTLSPPPAKQQRRLESIPFEIDRHAFPWNPQEDYDLIYCKLMGYKAKAISLEIGRSEFAISKRWRMINQNYPILSPSATWSLDWKDRILDHVDNQSTLKPSVIIRMIEKVEQIALEQQKLKNIICKHVTLNDDWDNFNIENFELSKDLKNKEMLRNKNPTREKGTSFAVFQRPWSLKENEELILYKMGMIKSLSTRSEATWGPHWRALLCKHPELEKNIACLNNDTKQKIAVIFGKLNFQIHLLSEFGDLKDGILMTLIKKLQTRLKATKIQADEILLTSDTTNSSILDDINEPAFYSDSSDYSNGLPTYAGVSEETNQLAPYRGLQESGDDRALPTLQIDHKLRDEAYLT